MVGCSVLPFSPAEKSATQGRRTIIKVQLLILTILASVALAGCSDALEAPIDTRSTAKPAATPVDRMAKIPTAAVKMSPETDEHPLTLYVDDYEQPVPLPGSVNTAGAEDSPFITPDGKSLYFFFTPDVTIPVEQQLMDGVTGIYVSKKEGTAWGDPQRIYLQEAGKLALDGCEFVAGNLMWFCSTRQGYTGIHWFTAEFIDGIWQNWTLADFDPRFQVGELHFAANGKSLYYGSERPGGKGGLDIWMSELVNGTWQEPINISAINTADSEGWPATNIAGDELWFTRNYGIWRSRMVAGEWQPAELVVSPLAGEPSLDGQGNLYFVHHYFSAERMIEADIYVAYKR